MSGIDEKIGRLTEELETRYSRMEITPLERDRITGKGKASDRVPINMQCHDHAAALAGIPVKKICTDPRYFYYSQLVAVKRYGYDSLRPLPDTYNIDVEAVGSRLKFPDDSLPVIMEPVVKEPEDLDRLEVPDPEKDGRMPLAMEAQDIHREHLGEYINMTINGCAPFSVAVGLRGFTNLAFDMARNPDFAHRLLQFATDVVEEYAGFLHRNTKRAVSFTDAWASIPNISPAQWDEFALPYTTQLLKAVPGAWTGIWGFSSHGTDWKSMLRKVAASGSMVITVADEDVDSIDLKVLKKAARSKNLLYGIAVMTDYILSDSEEMLTERVKGYLREAEPEGGFMIFGSMIPMDCPPEKVECFVKVCNTAGRYPIEG